MNRGINHEQQNHDPRIDRTLRRLGSVTPAAGIEDRISARLARERSKTQGRSASRARFFALPRFAIGVASSLVACVAIIAGSVNHSHRILPTVPGVRLPAGSSGMGAASAAHISRSACFGATAGTCAFGAPDGKRTCGYLTTNAKACRRCSAENSVPGIGRCYSTVAASQLPAIASPSIFGQTP